MTLKLDSRHLPRSFKEWEQLVLACGVGDDTIETHWLERKGLLRLGTTEHKFVVAKAILAFANRDPAAAEPYFDGHALVLIGVDTTGEITGVPRIEDHELRNGLRAYLGQDDDAPRWVVHRHRVDDHNDVVIIDIDAPRPGDPIFTLQKAYDKFGAGLVFSRPSTESAPADPSTIKMLSRRLTTRNPENFEVELTLNQDAVSSFSYDPNFLEPLLKQATGRYLQDLDPPTAMERLMVSNFGDVLSLGVRHEETRSKDEFRQEIEEWAAHVRQQLPELAKHTVAYWRPTAQFTLTNICGRFLEDLEVEVHIEGDVFQHPKPDDDEDVIDWLPDRPRKWGPWRSAHLSYRPKLPSLPFAGGLPFQRPNSTDFSNSGSVTAMLTCRELRPGRCHTFTEDDNHIDIVLLTSSIDMTTARVKVTATARGIDDTYIAEFAQPITPAGDITKLLTGFIEAVDYFELTATPELSS